MDDETAEIELLEQNLNKTRQISQRMTSILTSFDSRLVKLEKSILPLYNSTQLLTKRADNIESALQKIDEVASSQEGIAAEEALILRGPQSTELHIYKEALERLNASIAFKSSEADTLDTARLVETGAKKLTQLYTKLVAEGSSGTPPTTSSYQTLPFPADLLATLRPLVAFLRTLPLPSTHPSHPAAPAILSTLKEAQKGFADMRGNWAKKCLESQGRWTVERAEILDGVAAGREFGTWVDVLLTVAEDEYALLSELAPLPSLVPSTYTTLLTPLAGTFSSTLSSLTSLIKRSLHKYTFLALSTYASLIACQARWDDVLTRKADRKENELKDGLHSLRGVCLRSFPEFIADIRAAGISTPRAGALDTNTNLADISTSAVQYLESIPEVKDAVGSALLTLGDGNWRMGDGIQVKKGGKLSEGDEPIIIEHFTYDIVNATIKTLIVISRNQKAPVFGSIFLLNNIAYLRKLLLIEPRKPDVVTLFSKPTMEALNSNFRTAKAGYFDANFSPLMQALMEDKEKGGGKSVTKEKFTKFFDLFEEVTERHRMVKVLEDDKLGRETVVEEVVKLVVPSLRQFTQKNREKEFSKNPQKYIKMSPDEVEAQIRSFYK
ncbi:hypothetical protein JAAARDRAFT_161423 [Jaapia argillacea MUCL 33604]|uniref:Exocyst complex protein EXO70 n=1 Tax=Jaapia argillacea MUCL 33604 TaxID=933084 RepID=A0A067PR00_9AGAM|nr:hypothetical protein JAAARDRAFT_161423 [Jaapia argillacea MUCL 33604]